MSNSHVRVTWMAVTLRPLDACHAENGYRSVLNRLIVSEQFPSVYVCR